MTAVLDLLNGATRHKLTVDDYYRMAETGVLKRGERVELIDGEIIDMAPIGSGHAGNTKGLISVFARAVARKPRQTDRRRDHRFEYDRQPSRHPDQSACTQLYPRRT
jgi:Uma2 family endonuclease